MLGLRDQEAAASLVFDVAKPCGVLDHFFGCAGLADTPADATKVRPEFSRTTVTNLDNMMLLNAVARPVESR